ncbi:hypothetical protein T459_11280 [Capsicum annuum]|uniref:Reverse transcriptase/retrotransposon-derived protein RNase H-like domain-containing protein n=1 Tax=Capsicum annuum TaxID=4072 RepID=A0A2G2ZLG6_CAPAN|nr:hypothetical protein T459_11280 [Capsicum annuum]
MEPEASNEQTMDNNAINLILARLDAMFRDLARANASLEKIGLLFWVVSFGGPIARGEAVNLWSSFSQDGEDDTSRIMIMDTFWLGNFKWNDAAVAAFEALKLAITSAPVLALPDFSQEFIIETDALGAGIGAVLVQANKPVAFFSQGLSDKNKRLSVYERELLVLVSAVQRWRPYLLG